MRFWKQVFRPQVSVGVLAGGHVLTDHVEGKKLVNKMSIMKGREPGQVKVTTAFGQKHFTLSRIEWEQSQNRNGAKTKSNTILSTALVGSVGAITDVAVRAMKKDTSNAYIYLIDEDGEENETLIQCTKDQFKQVSRIAY
ncbi:hypothetical protein SRABI96_00953 [Peribacillus sp. Bi96]|uniref:hypothetical protein n=1 Tax=unclassified Peribacillus TaxID=2675266 RepID=UPI001D6D1D9B|nr:hypothetical protein [Peribacillus sp. Bi96]CAH0161098.1 hypothetical protein SRABI96_00953 [Peribacillus sp. Bi96]